MIIERARIKSNCEVAHNIWETHYEAPNIANNYLGAGQFINILALDDWSHPLRRPMSIASVEHESVSIIYKIFGDVTKILASQKEGEIVELMGPLGNTFSNWDNGTYPVLIGGGVGLAPILNLKKECTTKKVDHTMIIGAKSGNDHFIEHDPEEYIYLTTDDGTIGDEGTVMEPLKRIIIENNNTYLFACGPEPMLHAVREFALKNNIPAQLSVESYMGCGFGLCQGCVIERNNYKIRDHSYHKKYSLICLDGPVYEAGDISFG